MDISSLLNIPKNDENLQDDGQRLVFLDISEVSEDPKQPRKADNPGFSPKSLSDLASTILIHGLKTPISVRRSPEGEGYIVNHGARRLRAYAIARDMALEIHDLEAANNLLKIPAVIDDQYDRVSQFIENVQREALTPIETAEFIGELISSGMKKGDIAKSIGKSNSFVSQHVALLDMPEAIARSFAGGQIKDVTVAYDLIRLHKDRPDEVSAFLEGFAEIELTRSAVNSFREYIDSENSQEPTVSAAIYNHEQEQGSEPAQIFNAEKNGETSGLSREEKDFGKHENVEINVSEGVENGQDSVGVRVDDLRRIRKVRLVVSVKERTGVLLHDYEPPDDRSVYVGFSVKEGQVIEAVKCSDVRIVSLTTARSKY
jgi:ParB family chromosome partitioning protein